MLFSIICSKIQPMITNAILTLLLIILIGLVIYNAALIYDLTLAFFVKFNGQKIVPYVTTRNNLLADLLAETNNLIQPHDKILELGCGNAKVLKSLVRKYNCAGDGCELLIAPYLSALGRTFFWRKKIRIFHKNFFKTDFKNYSVIYGYLLPYLMPQVEKKIQTECAPGTFIIINTFPLPTLTPFKTIDIRPEGLSSKIYFYRI